MTSPFFITSSGTDVGKTLVTTTLCWQLKQMGKKVTALKPLITGFDPSDRNSDVALILQSCGLTPSREVMGTIAPWCFSAPLAPSMAAAKEGKSIDLKKVVEFCRDHLLLQSDIVLVEGPGGVMVPIDGQHTVLDWMQQLTWPAILVVGSYLGAISHALTAVEVLRGRKIAIRALVVNESEGSEVSLNDTVDSLVKLVPVDIPVVKLPRLRVKEEIWKHMPNISWICI